MAFCWSDLILYIFRVCLHSHSQINPHQNNSDSERDKSKKERYIQIRERVCVMGERDVGNERKIGKKSK